MGYCITFTPLMQMPLLSNLFKPATNHSGWLAVGISQSGVFFVHVQRGGLQPRVTLCTYHPATDVTSTLLEKLRKDARLGSYQFTTLLAPDEYQMLLVDAPNVPVNELKTAIRWRIKDMLSYHVDDATVDVLQIPSGKNVGDRPQSLYAVAASNTTVRKCVALFENAKIPLTVIDVPEVAQRNIAQLFEAEGRGLALLAFDEYGALLTFTMDGELYLTRRLDISSGQLQDANENLRHQYMDRIELEVQRSLDYFDRQFQHTPVSRLLISAPERSDLIKILAANLDLPVEKMNLAQVMDISAIPDLARNEFVAAVLPTLGAALRQERRAL